MSEISIEMSNGLRKAVTDWVSVHCPFPAPEEIARLKERLKSKGYIDLAASIQAKANVRINPVEECPRFYLYWDANSHGIDDASKAIIQDFLSTCDFQFRYHQEIVPEGIGEIRRIECNKWAVNYDFVYCLESEIAKLHHEAIQEANRTFQDAKRYTF